MDNYPKSVNILDYRDRKDLIKYKEIEEGRIYYDPLGAFKKFLRPFQWYVKRYIIDENNYKAQTDFRMYSFFHKLSMITTLVTFPAYRIFLEYSFQKFENRFHKFSKPEFYQIQSAIKTGTGFYAGYTSFLTAYFICSFAELINKGINSIESYGLLFFSHFITLTIAYPYFLNSNYAAINSPYHISLYNFKKYLFLYKNKKFYFGYKDFLWCNFLIFIPFLNYYAYVFEKMRIVKISAHVNNMSEFILEEFEHSVWERKFDKNGKIIFNIFPTFLNLYYFVHTFNYLGYWEMAHRYNLDFYRKSEDETYLEETEKKYPYYNWKRYLHDPDLLRDETLERYKKSKEPILDGYNFHDILR